MLRAKLGAAITALALTAGIALAAAPSTAQALTTGHTGSGVPALTTIGNTLYIAWTGSTGTANAKGLNLGWSTDAGKTITKVANGETSPQGEGPALDNDGTGVYIAWPGSDSAHTLNIAYYNGAGFTCKTTLTGATTTYSPALAHDDSGHRYLAWTDLTGHLNVATVDSTGCATTHTMALTNRTTLPQSAAAGPALVFDTSGSSNLGLVVAWPGTDTAHTINVASYVGTTTLADQTTVGGASTATASSTSPVGLTVTTADLYLGYRGTDGNLYLAYSEGCIPTCFSSGTPGPAVASGIGAAYGPSIWLSYFDATGHLNVSNQF